MFHQFFSSSNMFPEVDIRTRSLWVGDCSVRGFRQFLEHKICFVSFSSDMFPEVDIRTRSGKGIAQLGGFGTAGLPHLVFYCYHQSAQGGGERENINFNVEF